MLQRSADGATFIQVGLLSGRLTSLHVLILTSLTNLALFDHLCYPPHTKALNP